MSAIHGAIIGGLAVALVLFGAVYIVEQQDGGSATVVQAEPVGTVAPEYIAPHAPDLGDVIREERRTQDAIDRAAREEKRRDQQAALEERRDDLQEFGADARERKCAEARTYVKPSYC